MSNEHLQNSGSSGHAAGSGLSSSTVPGSRLSKAAGATVAATGITARLGTWVASVPATTSELAIRRAREAIEDTVACMVAGAGDEAASVVRHTVAAYGDGPSTIVGHGGARAAPPWAALANGMSAHALDFDDNFLPGVTHASAVLVPALLALGEARHVSGAALIDAYIVGLEAHACVGRGIGRGHYDLGWHNTATVGCIGTAAACARLLGLDADRTVRAISLGVSMASGAKVQFGSPGKPYHAGMAAHNAVLAATLAEAGMGARPDAIEGQRGFHALYAGAADTDWTALADELGNPLAIERFGLAPKLYPCCGSAHKVLDGVLALRTAHGLGAVDVARVDTLVGYGNQRNLCYPRPRQEMEARFSMQYCVAVALLDGRVGLAHFVRDAIARADVQAFLPRVHMTALPEGHEGSDTTKRAPHEVKLTLTDGSQLECAVSWARGTAENPFGQSELDAKFQDCCRGFLDAADYGSLLGALRDLATLDSVHQITGHLGYQAGADAGARFLARHAAE